MSDRAEQVPAPVPAAVTGRYRPVTGCWEPPPEVPAADLRLGPLLAEGGEGRVHLVASMPHLVFKSYRRHGDRSHLTRLTSWRRSLPSAHAQVVQAASAWPTSVVIDASGEPVGLLMARAGRRFSVRHRDGHSRLATLSYLTADPAHRAAAYGLTLPPPCSAERVGLVYALARLLAVFEAGDPFASHGDLSTKNVLWSLQRGPEVFVLDCDTAELFAAGGEPYSSRRRRAMTPNWDDPAVDRGGAPTPATDRYSLGLIFLRVVGAANFPVQARQRAGEDLTIDFPVPPGPGSALLLDAGAEIWRLCAASLSLTRPRPAASEWISALSELLVVMGAAHLVRSDIPLLSAQGGPPPALEATAPAAGAGAPAAEGPEVRIVPQAAAGQRPRTWTRVSPAPRFGPAREALAPAPSGFRYVTVSIPRPARVNPASAQPAAAPAWTRPVTKAAAAGAPPAGMGPASRLATSSGETMWSELSQQLARFWAWWLDLHRRAAASLVARGRRSGRLRTLAFAVAVDLAMLILAATTAALAISPIFRN